MKLPKKLKHDLVVFLTRSLFKFINLLPRSLALYFGSALGLLIWRLLPKERHRFDRHFTLVFGDSVSSQEKHVLARDYFVSIGKNLIDIIRFEKHFEHEIKPLVTIEGLDHFDEVYKRGKGLIGITGHLGNFELLAVYIASLGYKIAVIGREMYDKRMDEFLINNRNAMGLTNISTNESPRSALRWLNDGGGLGVLIDIDSSRVRGIFLPVFGRLAQTPVGQTMLGLRTGAGFLPMACLRQPDNSYRIVIKPEIEYKRTDDEEADIYNLTLACSRAVEEMIVENREQWPWFQNRWCARPEK